MSYIVNSTKFAIGIAMLTIMGIAVAAQSPLPVVRVEYVVSEQSPDRVEELLTSPLERTMRTLGRVVGLRSATGNSGSGVAVALEIAFEGGATATDLAAVLNRVSLLDIRGNVEPTFISVQLLESRMDHGAGLLSR